MRILSRFLLNLLLVLATDANLLASSRGIAYLQHEKRNELKMVSLIQNEKATVIVVHDLGMDRGSADKVHIMAAQEFNEMWRVLSDEGLTAFIFKPLSSDNMAKLGFYDLTLFDSKSKVSLRIPRESCPKAVLAIIDRIRSFMI